MQGNKRLLAILVILSKTFIFKKYWKQQHWKFLEIATRTATLQASFSKNVVIQSLLKLEFTQYICLEFSKIFQNTSGLLGGILVFGNVT